MGWILRIYLFALFFILFSFSSLAQWQTYQNDLRNTGIANGTGYLPLDTANFSDETNGMDFQPLVDDINNDDYNELIIFSNDFLKIFDYELNLIDERFVGTILGQPTIFNKNIIFNSRINSKSYFFAYQLNNSNLKQGFNITLSNDADFGGIKCLNLNDVNSCIFKDKLNYIHIVNIESKIDMPYNTSVYNETRQTVPAIGDIDNDGSMEAVFWFNQNNDDGYGLLVFDLSNRSLKGSFNNSGIVDNIFFPMIFNPQNPDYALKGQPVLVDLNNDNKLEIAVSVFYDDKPNIEMRSDWFTELIVFNSNGTLLFSKCELNQLSNAGCNDDSGTSERWEGTNPFVMDYDKNGIDDVCFIKDVKRTSGSARFLHMALNCYNYSGDETAKVFLTNVEDGIKGTAMAADMNNDGNKDIVTANRIYMQNGTVLLKLPFGISHPIAVDIDGNNGIDLVWTGGNETRVFLDNNNYTIDLSVSSSDISFRKFNETHINVSVLVKNTGQVEVKGVKTIIYNEDAPESRNGTLHIKKGKNITFSAVLGLKEYEKVRVSADYDNEINETNEGNNDAVREFIGLPYVFVSARQDNYNILSYLEPVFEDYVKNNLVSGYYTTKENEADVRVYIGKDNPNNKNNNPTFIDSFRFGYDTGNIIYNYKTGTNSYSALVAGVKEEPLLGKSYVNVMIVGNEVEGEIAGLKEFIKNQELFLNAKEEESIFVDDENADAIRVYDYLHLGGNSEHYNSLNEQFKTIVKNVLNNQMFNIEDKSVVTDDGITLRLRNLKPNISSDYLEYLNSTGMPVEMPIVMARGIHSNLTSWETLAGELANEGRNTWLAEITGGPGQDCDNCPNYNFSDLTDNYWPALVNGVLDFTGKEKLQYVGHSNGGRVAIVSLANGTISPNKIDTLIGVAVPSAFEGYSSFGNYFGKYGNKIMNQLNEKSHVSLTEIGGVMERFCKGDGDILCIILTKGLKSDNKMSFNVDKQLYLWIINTSDSHIGKNLNLDNFYIIQGYVHNDQSNNVTHDFIVTEQDEKGIYENIVSSNKKHYKIWGAHTAGWSAASLPDRSITKNIIKDTLNKRPLTKYKSNEINST